MTQPRLNETTRDLMLRAMISMAAADGDVADVEAATIAAIFEKVSGETVETAEIEKAAAGIAGDSKLLAADLAAASAQIDKNGKEAILRASYLVLRADGVVAAQERKKLSDIAKGLKMPEIHVGVILEQLEELDS